MTEREFLTALGKIPASRSNHIICAVNCKVPKEEFAFQNAIEEIFYDRLVEEANRLEKQYGSRPVFEMEEIDYDDPVLDIYREPANQWRKTK